jgi:hypothetical protein
MTIQINMHCSITMFPSKMSKRLLQMSSLSYSISFNYLFIRMRSWDSSVSIVSNYRLDNQASIPSRDKAFFTSLCVQLSSEDHPASYPMGTGGPFPGHKALLGRDADHSPPSSAKVKNE